MGYRDIFLVVFLVDEGPRDTFSADQLRVRIVELSVAGEKADVSDAG